MVEAADQGGLQAPPTAKGFPLEKIIADMRVTEPAQPALYAALARAQSKMEGALKQANNPHFRSKYADLGAVMDACKEALNNEGIAIFQRLDGEAVTTVLCHKDGGTLECSVPLILAKKDMQGLGSAITYARRYGLMCAAGIAPEDDDGNAAVESQKAAKTRSTLSDMNEAFETPDGVRMPAGSGKPAADPSARARQAADAIIEQFQGVKTVKGLDGVWDRNSAHIDRLEQAYPALHNDILDAYNGRKRAMEEEA